MGVGEYFSDAEIDWKIDTEVKSRTEPVLAVDGAEYIPDGYEIVEKDGYYYLCMLPEQLSLEPQADDQAADAAWEHLWKRKVQKIRKAGR